MVGSVRRVFFASGEVISRVTLHISQILCSCQFLGFDDSCANEDFIVARIRMEPLQCCGGVTPKGGLVIGRLISCLTIVANRRTAKCSTQFKLWHRDFF